MKRTTITLVACVLGACGQAVVPAPQPRIYIAPTCTLQQQTWIVNATDGTPVDQNGTEWQDGRAYWGADYHFTCLPLNDCGDLVNDPPRTGRDWIVLAPNCDTTQQAFEARVRGYVSSLE